MGVMPIFSGEEVTIAAVKSSLCMLLCIHLLGAWICAERGMAERLDPAFNCMNDLADRIGRLNDNADVNAFSRQTVAAVANADAIVAVCAPDAAGIGKEIALKLEEATWYTVGKWHSFDDILGTDPTRWSRNRFVIVHATRRTHIDAAVAVMRKLADAGIDFAVVTCPNRQQRLMNQLSGNRCLFLQCSGDGSQPYLDLVLYYRLALEVGFASGHGGGRASYSVVIFPVLSSDVAVCRLELAACRGLVPAGTGKRGDRPASRIRCSRCHHRGVE